MDMHLSGGCLCGAVRYSASRVMRDASTCHCRMCQRQSGAPFMAFVTVPRSAFAVTGEIRRYRSSPYAQRGFCPVCGSALTFEYDHEPDRVGITLPSLDDPEALPPAMHWGIESQLSWVHLADGLPRMRTEDDAGFIDAVARHKGAG